MISVARHRSPATVRAFALATLLGLAAAIGTPATALVPRDIASVAFAPAAGTRLPLGVPFVDERGEEVTLARYVGERPALVVLGWYGCSELCSVVLRAVDAGLRDAGLVAGRDVEIVVASIAPLETVAL